VREWSYRLHTFLILALNGGEGQLSGMVALQLEKQSLVPIGLEARWDPDPVWILYRREKSLPLPKLSPHSTVVETVA
jgi:hypothetical protein